MGLLDKKSVKLDAVQDFSWSPADPVLCALPLGFCHSSRPSASCACLACSHQAQRCSTRQTLDAVALVSSRRDMDEC